MPYPEKPTVNYAYGAFVPSPAQPFPGSRLDADFAEVVAGVNDLNDFVRGVTRSDGKLANRIVTAEALSQGLTVGWNPPKVWSTGASFVARDTVIVSNVLYLSTVEHTAGAVFLNDVSAGLWVELADFTDVVLTDGSVTAAKLADDAVTAAKLATGSVTADAIATGAVGADEIAAGAVGTDEVAAGAVTNAKLADMAGMTLKGRLLASAGAPTDVTMADLSKAIGLSLTRADIPTTKFPVSSFIAAGYATVGDAGQGAVYRRGTSGGVMAIQDADSLWWELDVSDAVDPGFFGAAADGVTDDSAAIQAALTAAPWVRLGPRTYYANAEVVCPSYRVFDGGSWTSIVKLGPGVPLTGQFLRGATTSISAANERTDTQILVRNVTFDCAARPYPAYLQHPTLGTAVTSPATDPIRNVPVTTPLTTNGTTTATAAVPFGIFAGMAVSGTYIAAGTTVASVSGSTVTLSQAASGTGTAATTFTPATPYSVRGNVLYFLNASNVLVEGCTFLDHGGTCVLMQGCIDSGTRNNFLFRCGREGFSSICLMYIHTGSAWAIVGATAGATTVFQLNRAHSYVAPQTPTITTTGGSTAATVSSATNLSVGMEIVSANVPVGATIAGLSGTNVTLSEAASGSGTGTAATFYTRVMVYSVSGLGGLVTDGAKRVTAVPSTTSITLDVDTSSAKTEFVLDGRAMLGSYFLTLADRNFSENDRGFALKRALIQAGAGRDHRIVSPSIRGGKEGGIYLSYLYDSAVEGGNIRAITRADLICEGVETNFCGPISFNGLRVKDTDGPAYGLIGHVDAKIIGGGISNPIKTAGQVFPYGPFNEGYFGGGFQLGMIETTSGSGTASVAAVVSPTITTTLSTTVTPASMVGIEVGMTLVSANIPAGAYVTALGTTTFTISSAATLAAGPTACSFYPVNVRNASTATVTTVNGSRRVTPSSMADIEAGQAVISANIPAGTIVERVETTTVWLSAAATGAGSGTACTWRECRRLISPNTQAGTLVLAVGSLPSITLSKTATASTGGTPIGARFNPYDSSGAPIKSDQKQAVLINSSGGYPTTNVRFDATELEDNAFNAAGLVFITRAGGTAGINNRIRLDALDLSRFQRNGKITGITQANPAVVTTEEAHGLRTGAEVYLRGVDGMTAVNGGPYIVTVASATTFSLNGIDSSAFGAFSGADNFWGTYDENRNFFDANTALGSKYSLTQAW